MPDKPADQQRLIRNTRRVLIVLVVLAVILAIWGIASRLIHRSHLRQQTTADAQVTVITVKPELSQASEELTLPGTVSAFMEAPIYARASGYLKEWYTDIGTHVNKGEVLALIDIPEVDRQLGQAEADLESAKANAALAQSTNRRWQGLVATQAVSRQDADEKASDASAKTAAQASAQQNVARLEDLESYRHVTSPFDGIVTARNTDVGDLINAGQSTGAELFRVADIHVLRVYAQVPQASASAIRAGLKAQLEFAEHPNQTFDAQISRTANALDPNARTLQVELLLDNKEGLLFPGAYAEIHFKLPSPNKTYRVPSNTILFRSEGLQVATVDPSHKIKMKGIVQGRDFGKTIEVLGGIDARDDLVINPSDSIEDGIPVRIGEPPKSSGPNSSAPGGNGSGPSKNGSGPQNSGPKSSGPGK